MVEITPEQIEEYQNNGAVLLRSVFSEEWIQKVKDGIEMNLQNPSKYSERLKAEGGSGYYFNDYCNWQTIPQFKDYVQNSPAAEIAGKLMKSQRAVFYHEHVLTKDPGTNKKTPWHQDQPYYPVDGMENVSLWMPVDPVSLETTIEFVRGSHHWGKWFHPKKFATSRNYVIESEDYDGKIFEQVPDVDQEREKYDILKWVVQPGDCVAFHMLTLHGAPENTTSSPRRVLSTRWLGDDCVLARRPWEVSPPVLGGLKYGDPMVQADLFPVMWQRK